MLIVVAGKTSKSGMFRTQTHIKKSGSYLFYVKSPYIEEYVSNIFQITSPQRLGYAVSLKPNLIHVLFVLTCDSSGEKLSVDKKKDFKNLDRNSLEYMKRILQFRDTQPKHGSQSKNIDLNDEYVLNVINLDLGNNYHIHAKKCPSTAITDSPASVSAFDLTHSSEPKPKRYHVYRFLQHGSRALSAATVLKKPLNNTSYSDSEDSHCYLGEAWLPSGSYYSQDSETVFKVKPIHDILQQAPHLDIQSDDLTSPAVPNHLERELYDEESIFIPLQQSQIEKEIVQPTRSSHFKSNLKPVDGKGRVETEHSVFMLKDLLISLDFLKFLSSDKNVPQSPKSKQLKVRSPKSHAASSDDPSQHASIPIYNFTVFKEENLVKSQFDLLHAAATVVSQWYYQILDRRVRVKLRKLTAQQKLVLSRWLYNMHEQYLRRQSATRIQRKYLSYRQRKLFLRYRVEAVKIQSLWRKHVIFQLFGPKLAEMKNVRLRLLQEHVTLQRELDLIHEQQENERRLREIKDLHVEDVGNSAADNFSSFFMTSPEEFSHHELDDTVVYTNDDIDIDIANDLDITTTDDANADVCDDNDVNNLSLDKAAEVDSNIVSDRRTDSNNEDCASTSYVSLSESSATLITTESELLRDERLRMHHRKESVELLQSIVIASIAKKNLKRIRGAMEKLRLKDQVSRSVVACLLF